MVQYVAQRDGTIIEEEAPVTESVDIRVTDYQYGTKIGYRMNRWLYNNLKEYPKHLKDYSSVMLISGDGGAGGTQVGKSTLGFQVGYFVSWMIAGGKMNDDGSIKEYPTEKPIVHYFFDTDELVAHLNTDQTLNQVIILDESDHGVASTAQGEKAKRFYDTVDRTAYMHYLLILIQPDFFRFGKKWAAERSDCLLLAYTVQFKKGYFKFWNRQRKEGLYKYGKMKGTRYYATYPNFWGRFPPVFVGDYDAYLEKKKLARNELTAISKSKQTYQRDVILKKALDLTGLTYEEFSKEMNVPIHIIHGAVTRINLKEKYDKKKNEDIALINDDPVEEEALDENALITEDKPHNIVDDIKKQMELENNVT